MTIHLSYTVEKIAANASLSQELSGHYAVNQNTPFDHVAYAETCNLNSCDIDADDVHAIQDVQSQLNDGEWIFIDHEVN